MHNRATVNHLPSLSFIRSSASDQPSVLFCFVLVFYIPTQEVPAVLDKSSIVGIYQVCNSLVSKAPTGQQAMYLLYIIPQRIFTSMEDFNEDSPMTQCSLSSLSPRQIISNINFGPSHQSIFHITEQ